MNGAYVGSWRIEPQSGDVLEYDPGWVQSEQGRPVSLSLPFLAGNRPHHGAVVRAYFDNLLPDSQDIRARVASRFQTGATDAFALLSEIGRDCVGALQILPLGCLPDDVTSLQATPLTTAQVVRQLRGALAADPLSRTEIDAQDFRISIAGAQEKTALLRLDGQWCLPHGATPTTHILKLPLGLVGNLKFDLSESVENEWLCAEILSAYGLAVAPTEVLTFDDMKVLAVERFDRRWHTTSGKRWLVRLPQEDMCQATGTPPHLKYESDGGPGIDSIMHLLESSSRSESDRRVFFQAQVLFWMLAATDGHAKNFSISLLANSAYQLAPLYDVLSAYPIVGTGAGKLAPQRAKMAMAVRSKNAYWRMSEIHRRHWLMLGERYGITTHDGKDAAQVVDSLIEQTPEVVRSIYTRLPEDFPGHVADSILNGLQAAARRLAA